MDALWEKLCSRVNGMEWEEMADELSYVADIEHELKAKVEQDETCLLPLIELSHYLFRVLLRTGKSPEMKPLNRISYHWTSREIYVADYGYKWYRWAMDNGCEDSIDNSLLKIQIEKIGKAGLTRLMEGLGKEEQAKLEKDIEN